MLSSLSKRIAIIGSLALMLVSINTYAQKKDSTKTVGISSATFSSVKTDSGQVDKFIGNVHFQQEADMLYCDSAYRHQATNILEAFGDVRIIQPGGTQASSDYLRYTSDEKIAYMRGNVSLTDGKSTLKCEELTYDRNTKIGTYNQGGTLQNDQTTVTSNSGVYDVATKDARFTGDVYITDPEYVIRSADLSYNTETKLMRFFDTSVVTGKNYVLRTSNNSTYDSKNEIADFHSRSSILNDDQYLEADTIYYNKLQKYGDAKGRVISIDTTQHTTLYCGHAEFFEKKRVLWATIKPVLKQMNGQDSLFIRADTFYSAPVPKHKLTKGNSITRVSKAKSRRHKKQKLAQEGETTEVAVADTTETADSTQPRYYTGYHHVRIFSDSMQGVCDSIAYTQADSVMRMMYNPVAWARRSQITGDTIVLKMDSGKVKKVYVPNNAFVVSQSGPQQAGMYDQVQGKTLTGYFQHNQLTHMVVFPNAESIYFSKDDKGAYIGMDQTQSEKMKVFFKDQKISTIKFEQDAHMTMTPLTKVNFQEARLSRFQWLDERRPRSLKELFE